MSLCMQLVLNYLVQFYRIFTKQKKQKKGKKKQEIESRKNK